MSFFGKNIKKIRIAKKLSQTAFANLFNLKRSSIGAYEEGRAEAKIDTIIVIADYFKLTLNQLLVKELTINEIFHFDELKKANNKLASNELHFVKNSDIDKFIVNHNNNNYIKSLEKIIIPHSKTSTIAFECINDKLYSKYYGIKLNDILVGQVIDITNIDKIKKCSLIIAIRGNSLLLGILSLIEKKLIIRSDNTLYNKEEIDLNDIKKIYLVKKIISNYDIPDFEQN